MIKSPRELHENHNHDTKSLFASNTSINMLLSMSKHSVSCELAYYDSIALTSTIHVICSRLMDLVIPQFKFVVQLLCSFHHRSVYILHNHQSVALDIHFCTHVNAVEEMRKTFNFVIIFLINFGH